MRPLAGQRKAHHDRGTKAAETEVVLLSRAARALVALVLVALVLVALVLVALVLVALALVTLALVAQPHDVVVHCSST